MDELTSNNTLKVMINPYLEHANLVFMGASEFSIASIQTAFNNSMRIASNTKLSDKKRVSDLMERYELRNFKEKILLSLLRIIKRKVDRARAEFEGCDYTGYEYSEYTDGGTKIISVNPRHINKKEDNSNRNIQERKEDVSYKISQSKISIIRYWDCPKKVTRNLMGYTVVSFDAKKSKVCNSSAIIGPKLWNILPFDIRNNKFKKEDFTESILGLLDKNHFELIYKTTS